MQSQKLITSISTIPNESKLYFPKNSLNYSLTDLKMPPTNTLPLKFPKKYIRKQTNMTMLAQTKYFFSHSVKILKSLPSEILIMPTEAKFFSKPVPPEG